MESSKGDDLSIIDCHVHFTDVGSDGKILEIINKASLKKMNLLSTMDTMKLNFNPELIYMKIFYPHLFYTFGALEYPVRIYSGTNLDLSRIKRISLVKQVDELVDIGFDGIKMLEGHAWWRKHVGPLNSKRYKEYFRYVESLRFPILAHANASGLSEKYVSETEPRPYDKRQYPLRVRDAGWYHPLLKKARLEVADILKACPNLKIIFAHFGGLSKYPEQASEVLDGYKNLHLDVTPGYMMYNWSEKREEWREFFIRYQDRIIFGSDVSSSQSVDAAVALINRIRKFLETGESVIWGAIPKKEPTIGLNLPEQVLRKIYAENFERVVGKNPRELNLEPAITKCERMAKMMNEAGPWHPSAKNTAEHVENLLRQRLKE